MGQLMLNRVMSMQQDGPRLQIQPHNGPADSTVDRKDLTCKQDHCSQGGETQCPGPHLPEMIDTPVLHSKFLHLKHLNVDLQAMTFPPTYDYCSLIYLFDASPSLETLVMNVSQKKMLHESIVGDASHLRQMPGHRHDSLKTVKIIGFSSAKSLIELTCHIIENTTSLECLTLDTTTGHPSYSCLTNNIGKCLLLGNDFLVEVGKGLLAMRTYVEPKVPSIVKLNVVEPCRRCHDQPLS